MDTMSLLLKLPIFEDVNKYIEQELKTRYSQLIDKFVYDLDCVITIDQRRKLNEYFNSLDIIGEPGTQVSDKITLANLGSTIKEDKELDLGLEQGLELADLEGPKGPKGLKGPKGPKDPKGPKGPKGLKGDEWKQKLANKYYLNIHVKLDPHYSTYNCTRVDENSLNRCQARTSNGTQCTRAHNNSITKLCGSHMRANPHGQYGGSNPTEEAKLEKRLQNSHKTVKNLKGIDISEYIKTTEIELDGKTYLLDDNGILYDLTNFNILAHIQDYKVYWFTS
jgi:hypothetical protein